MLKLISTICITAAVSCLGLIAQQRAGHSEEPEHFVLSMQMNLAKFGYGVRFTGKLDDQTIRAVREYQSHSRLAVTGDLDGATTQHIVEDGEAIRPVTKAIAYRWGTVRSNARGEIESIYAQGVWIPNANYESGSYYEVSKLSCILVPEPGSPTGFCEDTSVGVDPQEGHAWSAASLWHIHLRVTYWNNLFVEAEAPSPLHSNVTYNYRFDLTAKTATRLLLRKGAVPPFEPVEQYTLTDPLKTAWKWKDDEVQKARRRIMVMSDGVSLP